MRGPASSLFQAPRAPGQPCRLTIGVALLATSPERAQAEAAGAQASQCESHTTARALRQEAPMLSASLVGTYNGASASLVTQCQWTGGPEC